MMESAIKSSRFLNDFSASNTSNLCEKTICAEVLHTNFIVQHNISFLTADDLAPLYSKMFPDSQIAKNFRCSKTKTTCILNEAMCPQLKNLLIGYMKENPFLFIMTAQVITLLCKEDEPCLCDNI